MKFKFIAKHRGIWPLTWMCEVLDVSPTGFYSCLSRPPSKRQREDEVLIRQIRGSFTDSGDTYGVRRVWPALLAWGYDVGRERVARLMRQQALKARPPKRKRPKDRGERPAHPLAPNKLDRSFDATRPNELWTADITYIWATEGWLFLAVVLALYSRRVVGWSMKARMTSDLVIDALMMALWRRGPSEKLMHHCDQGSQYTSDTFQRLLCDQGIECSMSRKGDCWDNSPTESVFSSLKAERVDRKIYRTRDAARADVFDYIERFYNPKRRHSTLGYVSPMKYENQAKLA